VEEHNRGILGGRWLLQCIITRGSPPFPFLGSVSASSLSLCFVDPPFLPKTQPQPPRSFAIFTSTHMHLSFGSASNCYRNLVYASTPSGHFPPFLFLHVFPFTFFRPDLFYLHPSSHTFGFIPSGTVPDRRCDWIDFISRFLPPFLLAAQPSGDKHKRQLRLRQRRHNWSPNLTTWLLVVSVLFRFLAHLGIWISLH